MIKKKKNINGCKYEMIEFNNGLFSYCTIKSKEDFNLALLPRYLKIDYVSLYEVANLFYTTFLNICNNINGSLHFFFTFFK